MPRPLTLEDAAMKPGPGYLIYQKSGISIVEILIALGLVGIMAAAFTSMFMNSERQQGQMNLKFQADLIRKNLTVALNTQASWQNTIATAANNRASGPALDCLVNSTPCTNNGTDLAAGGTALTNMAIKEIRDNGPAGGQIAYDLNSAGAGFTSQGTVCNTFIAPPAVGNDACPLKFNITWTAMCGASCVRPQVP